MIHLVNQFDYIPTSLVCNSHIEPLPQRALRHGEKRPTNRDERPERPLESPPKESRANPILDRVMEDGRNVNAAEYSASVV